MEYPGSQAEQKFNSYKPNDLYQKGIDLCNRKYHSTSVITQGDSWIPNYMINKTTQRKVVMLDFQLARCTSPVLDVSPFIYVCTERSIWYENFNILLKFYYDELANAIHLLGSNPEKVYSWDTFMNEVNKIKLSYTKFLIIITHHNCLINQIIIGKKKIYIWYNICNGTNPNESIGSVRSI